MPDQGMSGIVQAAPAEAVGRILQRPVHGPAPPVRRGAHARAVHGVEHLRRQDAWRAAHLRQHPAGKIADRGIDAARRRNAIIGLLHHHRHAPLVMRPRPARGMFQAGRADAGAGHAERPEQPRLRDAGIALPGNTLDDLRCGVIRDVLIGIAGARRAKWRERAQRGAKLLGVLPRLQPLVPRVARQADAVRQHIRDGDPAGIARQRQRRAHRRQRCIKRQLAVGGQPDDQR